MTLEATTSVRLGRTSLSVTRLGLGTAPLGGLYREVSDETALGTLSCGLDLGLRLIDTAPYYGHGLAEERVGRSLDGRERDSLVIATKVGRLLRPVELGEPIRFYFGRKNLSPVFDFSYDGVMRSFEESLQRLGLDRVDILHIHDPDRHYDDALDGAYHALDRLRRDGSIAGVGVGMNQSAMLARFAREADFDCFLLAGRYTLLDQGALEGLLPVCAERGIAIIAGGVYNSGLLADPVPGARFDYLPAAGDLVARACHLAEVCARHGVPLKAAAIQFPFGHPAIASVVTGARTAAELRENVAMMHHPIPPDLWAELRDERLVGEDVPTP